MWPDASVRPPRGRILERARRRVLIACALAGAWTVGCDLFDKKGETEHPGCPGEAFRSATSDVDCICGKDKVLRAGALECKKCDPVASGGVTCDCPNGDLFNFDNSLGSALGLRSAQVTCVEASDCPDGQRPDAQGSCVTCAALDCGGSCAACPVAQACISGQCVAAAVCVVESTARYYVDNSGNIVQDLLPSCDFGPGDVLDIQLESLLRPGAQCDAYDQQDCIHDAWVIPLARPHSDADGCPGESSPRSADSSDCVCDEGEVLVAGSLECKDCDPAASGGIFCDCGQNALFSFSGLLDADLGLTSPRVRCQAPSTCEDGTRYDAATDACIACAATDCGAGCGLCVVGETCISGRCVAASACRVTDATKVFYDCDWSAGDLVAFDTSAVLPAGAACNFTDLDECLYGAEGELLSR